VSNGSVPEQNQGPISEQEHDDALAALSGEAPAISAVDAPAEEAEAPPPPVGAPPALDAPRAPDAPPAGFGPPAPDAPPPGAGSSRGAALAEAARAEAEERTRRAAEAHAARTAARAAAEADAEAARSADLQAEASRAAAVERSRSAAAAHTHSGDSSPDEDHIVPGFTSAPPGYVHPHPPSHDQVAVLRRTRRPAVGLVALVVLGFVAAFFGWVSADPFWLGTGQGETGTVTVARCESGRCEGQFTGDGFSAEGVLLSGVSPEDRRQGATAPARMLASDRDWAYVGPSWGLHLRWGLGLAAVLLCGLALGAATGAKFLRPLGRRASLGARLLALAGPLALFAGMLGAALI
jgi:hypothetical protein